MVQELKKMISDQPGFWLFMVAVVVVGGPAFVNQIAERYLPGTTQIEIARDVDWSERRSNSILSNQKRMLELLHALKRSVESLDSDLVGLDLRISRLEAWRHFAAKSMRESYRDLGP